MVDKLRLSVGQWKGKVNERGAFSIKELQLSNETRITHEISKLYLPICPDIVC